MDDALLPLFDPTYQPNQLDLSSYSLDQAILMLESMITIRLSETIIANAKKDALIGGPVHLGVGQEAVAVGVSQSLTNSDRVFGAHRSHSHILALGLDPYLLFAEVLGRHDGASKGMGGSMHLYSKDIGFFGSVPIVAGTVPLAVGAGLSAKRLCTTDLAVAYLGDGACEEGIVHESLNLASQLSIPVIFVVENNLFASHMHLSERQPLSSTSRFAIANNIKSLTVDGNNVVDVANAFSNLASHAREGNGPGFLEAITYRWYGHVDWRLDIDVGIERSETDLANWKRRDCISRLTHAIESHFSFDVDFTSRSRRIELMLNDLWENALSSPYPPHSQLYSSVFTDQ